MTPRRQNWTIFFTGIALLTLPTFYQYHFNGKWLDIFIYTFSIAVGVSCLLYAAAKFFKINPIYFFLLVLVFEIGFRLSFFLVQNNTLDYPELKQYARNFYLQHLRNIPAYQKDLGRYDSELFYTLQSGEHRNGNLEYSNAYQINSNGWRDDEPSLAFPEIICLGDSHTMGWGVNQEQTFTNLLERSLQKKVLNTGIVSYGTAREYLTFQKINTAACQTIIWQYCSNDEKENAAFVENDFQLNISSEVEYDYLRRRNFLQKNYYPFKFTFEATADLFRGKVPDVSDGRGCFADLEKSTNDFFDIVRLLQEDFEGNILIFNLESYTVAPEIHAAFEKYLNTHQLEKIKLLDVSELLLPSDFYTIDGHLNVSGHQKIGELLQETISESSIFSNGISSTNH